MKNKDIIVIGNANSGNIQTEVIKAINEKNVDIVVIPDNNTITINDESYIKTDNSKLSDVDKYLLTMNDEMFAGYKRKLDSNIDILEEFKLIQYKKSKLSSWERKQVIKEFNKQYTKLDK